MEAIVLAAGYSSRANAFKMTLPMGQMSVLEQTISKFEGLCSRIIVVAGFQAEIIQEEIAKIISKNAYSFQIKFVYNDYFNYVNVSFHSKGLQRSKCPNLLYNTRRLSACKKETVQLLAKHKGNVVIPSFDNKGGHPIKLSIEVKQKILETNPESNLRVVIGGYEKAIHECR